MAAPGKSGQKEKLCFLPAMLLLLRRVETSQTRFGWSDEVIDFFSSGAAAVGLLFDRAPSFSCSENSMSLGSGFRVLFKAKGNCALSVIYFVLSTRLSPSRVRRIFLATLRLRLGILLTRLLPTDIKKVFY